MREIWIVVLSLSFSGTVLLLALLLFCRIFRRKLSKSWQYYIWLAVAARLLLPFSGEINLTGRVFAELEQYVRQGSLSAAAGQYAGQESLSAETGQEIGPEDTFTETKQDSGRLREPADASQETERMSVLQPEDAGRSAKTTDDAENGPDYAREKQDGTEKAEALNRFMEYAGVLWLAAAAALLLGKIITCQNFARRIRADSEPADLELLEEFGRIAEEMGLKGTVELRINHSAASPMQTGVIRPMVILPSAELSERDFRYTVLHELTHYCRRDVCYKWLVQFVICLHWFNPFVRLLGRETDRACELACDEAVLEKLTADEKRAYGDTLLHAAEQSSPWKHSAGAVTLHESGKQLKGRLEAIMEYRRRPGWMKALSVVLSAGILGSAAVLGVYAGPKEAPRFTSGGDDFLLSDGTSVIERDDVIYILCDGLTEEKVPAAGVVDGTMIMVVHQDHSDPAHPAAAAASVSVTLSGDRSEILDEAKEICREMQQKKILSENDAELILETAGELQKRALPVHGDFDGSYYQSAYYQAPYLFYVGYDLTEEAVKKYAGTEITLENGEKLYVSFADSARAFMEEEDFLKMLCVQFSEFRSRTGSRVSGIRRPVISGVEAVGYDVEGLAEAYYEDDDIGNFSVMVSELSADRQKEYLEKAYQENNTAVLSIVLDSLYENGGLEEEWLGSLMFRAYEKDDIGFFCIFSSYLSEQARQEWYERMRREEGQYSPWAGILQEDTDEDDLWDDLENIWDED